jgi:protein TonB
MKLFRKQRKHSITLDDIVFERRNKEYGCYTIRSEYQRRIRVSFFIVLFVFGIVTTLEYLLKIYPINRSSDNFNTGLTEMVRYNPDVSVILLNMPESLPGKQVDLLHISEENADINFDKQHERTEIPLLEYKPVLPKADTASEELAADLLRRHKNNVEKENSKSSDSVFLILEKVPQFPGGDAAIQAYINKNQRYPVYPLVQGIQGSAMVSFKVNEKGIVEDVMIVTGIHPELDMEAVRLVKSMPGWTPAYYHGKPIACILVMPVDFKIK